MSFSKHDREVLLAVKGVGPTVVARLEQLGLTSLEDLAGRSATDICEGAAAIVESSCWKNSPQARKAISAAIEAARSNRAQRGSRP